MDLLFRFLTVVNTYKWILATGQVAFATQPISRISRNWRVGKPRFRIFRCNPRTPRYFFRRQGCPNPIVEPSWCAANHFGRAGEVQFCHTANSRISRNPRTENSLDLARVEVPCGESNFWCRPHVSTRILTATGPSGSRLWLGAGRFLYPGRSRRFREIRESDQLWQIAKY